MAKIAEDPGWTTATLPPIPKAVYGETEMKYESTVFVWHVKDFLRTIEDAGGNMLSPMFEGKTDHRWQLRLNTRRSFSGVTNVRIHLYLLKMSPAADETTKLSGIPARFSVSFMDTAGNIIKGPFGGASRCVYKELTGWGYNDLITMEGLRNNHSFLIPDGNLVIKCLIQSEYQLTHRICQSEQIGFPPPPPTQTKPCLEQLSTNMLNLFNNAVLSDLVIEVGMEHPTIFHVHKAVLIARSPALLDMLSNPEAQPVEKLCILSFDPDVVKAMLEYMYGGRITGNEELIASNAEQVLRIGSQYEMPEFLDMCDEIIAARMTCQNALDVLAAADNAGRSDLKGKAVIFINWNKSGIDSEAFQKLAASAPHVFKDLYLAAF